MNKPRLTEAGALREYIKIQSERAINNARALRKLVDKSNLLIDEARPFYELIDTMEKEAAK